ncbi:MAG: hypothetical protein HHJ14_12640 [Cellulomonas sp.]|nr:hypothetical protein [Cellulomonas sp.]
MDRYADQGDDLDAATIAARRPGSGGTATVDPAPGQELIEANTALDAAQDASRATPSHLPLAAVRPGSRLLETERRLLTHAIRLSAYNAESALARLLRPHYSCGADEGRALLREAFTLPGDLQIIDTTQYLRLDPPQPPDAAEPSPHWPPNSPPPRPSTPAPTSPSTTASRV